MTRPDLNVAIVGSGPAAFYAAAELARQHQCRAHVRMFERLPTPGGLARAGVAPDHAERRDVIHAYEALARSQGRFEFHGHVEVGRDIHRDELLKHHHAVIYATGANRSRELELPGAQLAGCLPAAAVVGWYNAHPDWTDLQIPLDEPRALVIGNGNVALDIARLLLKSPDELETSDLASHARHALRASRIREVLVVGRRGPQDAAFTHPELLELGTLEHSVVQLDDRVLQGVRWPTSYAMRLRRATLQRYAGHRPKADKKQLHLLFHTQLTGLHGDSRVREVELHCAPPGNSQADTRRLQAGLVIHAIGYRGQAQADLPFDPHGATIPHRAGRIMDQQQAVAGCYVTGWIKRGPRGVIGSNKLCARETVSSLLEDFSAGRLNTPLQPRENFAAWLHQRQPDAVSYHDWKALDRHERAAAAPGRPREKLTDVQAMLDITRHARRSTPAA